MNDKDLKELQAIQKNILKELHDLCVKENITYFLAYGTLLGAVRHKGFIPWDDDIDVFMTREEFEKLVFVASKLPDNLELEFLYTEKVENVCEARISRKDIVRYEINHSERKGNVAIDIFILDYAKKYKNKLFEKIAFSLAIYLKLSLMDEYERKWALDAHSSNSVKKAIIRLSSVTNKLHSNDDILRKYKGLITSDNIVNDVYHSVGSQWFYKERYKTTNFNQISVPFEDITAYAPSGYDELLTEAYGDYVQLPPEEERFTYKMKDYIIEYI